MMKRLSAILALLLFGAALTACSISEADEPLYTTRPPSTTTAPKSSNTSDNNTTITTDGSEAPSTDTTTAPPATTAPPTTTPPPTTTAPPSPNGSVVVTVEPNVIEEGETFTGKAPLPTITMTVNDPENKAGLSDERHSYSFGAAKDGKPHSISVGHQEYFDTHNRNALTLDTITEEKVLYLTFDCGYEWQDITADILDTLAEKDVPAAFFCTLDYLETKPDFVVRMINEGHIVGNHSTTHPVMPTLTKEEMAAELLGVDNYLRVNFGYTSPYFRFPTGAYSDEALELIDSIGFRSIFWSIAHSDWDTANQPGKQKTFDTITSRLHPGSVILLHAVSRSNADALADIIDYAREQGYEFRSLDQYPGW